MPGRNVSAMPMPKRADVDDYIAQLPEAAVCSLRLVSAMSPIGSGT